MVILSHTILCSGQFCLSCLRLFNVAFEGLHLPHLHYSAVTAVFQDQNVPCQWNDSVSLLFEADWTCCNFTATGPWHQPSTALEFSPVTNCRRELELQISKKNTSHLNSQRRRQNTQKKKRVTCKSFNVALICPKSSPHGSDDPQS